MQPNPTRFLETAEIGTPPIGFYDAPDPSAFEPLVRPPANSHTCVFAYFKQWLDGKTLHLTEDNFGCGGAGRSLCGVPPGNQVEFVKFLVEEEGLKASADLMEAWLEYDQPYERTHANILIGPLRPEQYPHLRSVTFYVTPDQLGLLSLGAQYRSHPSDPRPVLAPFGSGCMQLVTLFDDLDIAQAVVGTTDVAMRKYVPPTLLGFSVTKPLFEQLCNLDERSFLYKGFWKDLKKARAH